VTTYNDPYPAGFKHTYFLLDPHTYDYLNATFQHDDEAPKSYAGNYSTDTLRDFGLELLDNAVSDGKPFFLTLAPIAPHSNINPLDGNGGAFTEPIPAERHRDLFPDAMVPRTENFNPDAPSGGSWVARLPKQNNTVVAYNDHFYRQRLRSLQALDELVDSVFARLESYGLLDNTYVVYSADNGFHIGQHRLQPGKTCGYEEDINVPLIVRGPGVAKGKVVDGLATSHTDLAPTFLKLLGLPTRSDFDGIAIPLTKDDIDAAIGEKGRGEHVNVEYWGSPYIESEFFGRKCHNSTLALSKSQELRVFFVFFLLSFLCLFPHALIRLPNPVSSKSEYNTFKSVRVFGNGYSLYYSVWCNNEHELYDMTVGLLLFAQIHTLSVAHTHTHSLSLSLFFFTLVSFVFISSPSRGFRDLKLMLYRPIRNKCTIS
jgi:hypothetical protein